MGALERPRGAANYGDIPSDLYYNQAVVIHADTEICSVLFGETFTQSLYSASFHWHQHFLR